jgi:hypothetical protein
MKECINERFPIIKYINKTCNGQKSNAITFWIEKHEIPSLFFAWMAYNIESFVGFLLTEK